ncbi:peptidase domain-containing ABC transporter [Marinagarivorans algicola]|uniref:peptidase domain-containing ABC transporter n=1 Tax=Marinagarivorans algicola TaxID=1513270 RepID=UPI0037358C50
MNAQIDANAVNWMLKSTRIEEILSQLRMAGWINEQGSQPEVIKKPPSKKDTIKNSTTIDNYPNNDVCSETVFNVQAGSLNHKSHSALVGYESAMVCLAVELDLPITERTLCDYIPHGRTHLECIDVLNALANLGYLGHEISVKADMLDDRLFPCLYTQRGQSPIVILSAEHVKDKKMLTLYDCLKERVMTVAAQDINAGIAFVFTKESDSPQPLSSEYMSASGFTWFRALLERFKGIFWQVFSVSIMINMVAIAAPLFVMLVYDRVIGAHSPETLMPLIVGAFLALSCEAVLRFVRLRNLSWFSSRVDTIVGNHIFSQLIFMPITFTERASVSAQIARIKAFESIRDFFNGPLFLALIELPFTLLILVAIAIIAGKLAIVPLVIAGLYLILLFFTGNSLRTATRLSAKNHSICQQMTFETFQKMHGIRASGIADQWMSEYRKVSGRASLSSFKAAFISSQIEVVSHAIFVAAGLMIIYLGVLGVLAGEITAGALIATTLLVWRILTPFKILCNSIGRFEQVRNSVDQVNRLMAINTEQQDSQSHTRINDLKGDISFSKVGIRYSQKSDPVFTGLTFLAKPGNLIAITGGNGSGKSTILQLINGFYKPQAGNIRIDGVDIRQLDLIDLRKNIAYVPQVPHFFNGSIAENLRMADPLVNNQMIKVALNQVDAWEDICALPQGVETRIGVEGYQLPSGLSYKLNLARAYIKNTPLMLFDELPYALLNSTAGEAFRQTIDRWKGHRTVILVSHREDYLKMADTVILLTTGDFPIVGSPELIIEAINKSNNE